MSIKIGFKFTYCNRRWKVIGFSKVKVFFQEVDGSTKSQMDLSIFERIIEETNESPTLLDGN